MALTDALLPEFDMEMASTRKTLERVPLARMSWKPHEKSMTMGRLASHLAETVGWLGDTLASDSFDMAPPGGEPMKAYEGETPEAILEAFDKNANRAREALSGATDEALRKPWSLLKGGETLFTAPKIGIIRTWVLNHSIHHRAQLGVYLRLNDIAVPSIYGPSADEGAS
jgi:uncharacterized damage-inducible protein DinB